MLKILGRGGWAVGREANFLAVGAHRRGAAPSFRLTVVLPWLFPGAHPSEICVDFMILGSTVGGATRAVGVTLAARVEAWAGFAWALRGRPVRSRSERLAEPG